VNRKRLIGSDVVIPTGGVNLRRGGLLIERDETPYSLNMRYEKDAVRPRPGLKRVTYSSIPGLLQNPILHMHVYESVTGVETLFGFTKDCVYKYTDATNTWELAIPNAEVFGTSGELTVNTGAGWATDTTDTDELTARDFDCSTEISSAGDIFYYVYGSPKDLSDYTDVYLYMYAEGDGVPATGTFTVDFMSTWDATYGSRVIEDSFSFNYADVEIGSDGAWFRITDTFTGTISAIEAIAVRHATGTICAGNTDLKLRFGLEGENNSSFAVTPVGNSSDITEWDTCPFADSNDGLTVLATSGAIPSHPLMYLDVGNLWFEILEYETTSPASATSTDEHAAKLCTNFVNRGFFINTYEKTGAEYAPYRMWFTDLGDAHTILTVSSFINRVDVDVSPIVRALPIGYATALYREDTIELLAHVGGVYQWQIKRVADKGCPAGRTVAGGPVRHYFLGWDNVYTFDGSNMLSIGDNIVPEYLPRLDINAIEKSFGVMRDDLDEYWLFLPLTNTYWNPEGSPPTYPNTIWTYNRTKRSWGYHEIPEVVSAALYHNTEGQYIDDLVGNIDDQMWFLEGNLLKGLVPSMMVARSDGKTCIMDGSYFSDDYLDSTGTEQSLTVDCELHSSDFVFQTLDHSDRITMVEFEASGESVIVEWSGDYGKTWNDATTINLSGDYTTKTYWMDAYNDHVQIRFRDGFFSIRWIQAFAIRRGRV